MYRSIDITELQRKRDNNRRLAYHVPSDEHWTKFRNVKGELKSQNKETKAPFYQKILTSKNSKEIWKVIYRIIRPNESTSKAERKEPSKCFNETTKKKSIKSTTC